MTLSPSIVMILAPVMATNPFGDGDLASHPSCTPESFGSGRESGAPGTNENASFKSAVKSSEPNVQCAELLSDHWGSKPLPAVNCFTGTLAVFGPRLMAFPILEKGAAKT